MTQIDDSRSIFVDVTRGELVVLIRVNLLLFLASLGSQLEDEKLFPERKIREEAFRAELTFRWSRIPFAGLRNLSSLVTTLSTKAIPLRQQPQILVTSPPLS